MKTALTLITLSLTASIAHAGEYVSGHIRSDGTYVQGHWRSSPDSSYNNNWSVKPNINPYTGERGSKKPTWDDNPPDDYGYDGYDSGW